MEIKKFLGLRNVTSAERYRPGELEVAQNLEIDDTGKLMTRRGVALLQAGSYHSLFSDGDLALVMLANVMYRINLDFSLTQLAVLSASARVSYNRQGNVVYFSNGVDKGRIDGQGSVRPWGIKNPVSQPVAAPTGGQLPPGRYMYALTFRRANGMEGGTGTAGVIELASTGGISFSSIESSTDVEVTDKIVYLSGANGTELYRAAVLPASAASYDFLGRESDLTARLDTQYVSPPPAGPIVEVYNGVAYVVVGSTAFHSDPYLFENFRIRDSFLTFPGQVTMFASVNDGIYVGTSDTVWFLKGGHPKGDMKSQVCFNYGAIPGTAVKTVEGVLKSVLEAEEGGPGGTMVMWTSPFGVCVGSKDGQVQNMTERQYSFPSASRGAAMVRHARGITIYLASLEGGGVAANKYS